MVKFPANNRVLELIPRDRLTKYLKSASMRTGMSMRLLDLSGTAVVAPPGACPAGLLNRAAEVMGEEPMDLICPEGYRIMAAPVGFGGEKLGYLFACKKDDGLTDGRGHDLPMLSLAATHLEGLAETGYEVESLSGEVVRVYEELSLIYGLTAKLSAKVDVEEICRVVADEAERLLDPSDIMVQLADEDQGVMRTVFAAGLHRDTALSFAPRMDEGLVGRAYAGHRSVLVCEVDKDRRHTGWPFPIRRLLAVPLIAEDKTLGIITATDKKDGAEFNSREEKLISAISSVAAIAIKNAQLYSEIKALLDGFINASVTAVESRDPATAGHSTRVAMMTVELAKKVDASDLPAFRNISFTREQLLEMQYAGLLHDFGKIGVREAVLLKETKLYPPHQMEIIKARFTHISEVRKRDALERKIGLLLAGGREKYREASAAIDAGLEAELERLRKYLELIEAANDPHVLLTDLPELATLDDLANIRYKDPSGEMLPCLTPSEFRDLHVLKGSLNPEERHEIEQHVTHSYNFLIKVPWTRSLRDLAGIVYAHHEKLDGSGYPRGLNADEIPIQAKMMTVADIYDALTSWDRPYKKAVSTEKAMFILDMEASEGKIDPHLVQIFRDARIYTVALELLRGK